MTKLARSFPTPRVVEHQTPRRDPQHHGCVLKSHAFLETLQERARQRIPKDSPLWRRKPKTNGVNENYWMLKIEAKLQRGGFRRLFPEGLVESMQRFKTRPEPDSGHRMIFAEFYVLFSLVMNMLCAWRCAASASDSCAPQRLSSRNCYEQPALQRKH